MVAIASLVLIHGGAHDASWWEAIVERLTNRRHDVCAIDLPGRGDTAEPLAAITLDDWVCPLPATRRHLIKHPRRIWVNEEPGRAATITIATTHGTITILTLEITEP